MVCIKVVIFLALEAINEIKSAEAKADEMIKEATLKSKEIV